jgi:hypothetical protein
LAAKIEYDAGSFKDADGRVFLHEGRIFRTLSAAGREAFDQLVASALYSDLLAAGEIVPSALCESSQVGLPAEAVGATLLEHERIPFVTYPYEWSFSMLRDAALLTLSINERALERGLILKDATPFNVQFRDAKPIFVDVLSFEPYRAGEPWVGYSQFCSTFLYPLMLTAYKRLEFHALLRGALGVINCKDADRLFGWRDALRPGVMTHVKLMARFQRSFENTDVKLGPASRIAYSKDMILANTRALRKLLNRLRYAAADSAWANYATDNSYTPADQERKASFVEAALASARPTWVWDLGGNVGVYSELAARGGARVLTIDADPAAIDGLYQAQKRGHRSARIQGLVCDLCNPSPAMGWRLRERTASAARGRADFFLALALVHHLAISGNIPLEEIVDYLRETAPQGVVEFVGKADPMVKRLLARRRDVFTDYDREHFEAALSRHFRILGSGTISTGTRTLYHLSQAHSTDGN